MREILTFQVGNCGNQMGQQFWEVIANEHGLDPAGHFVGASLMQEQYMSVYFHEGHNRHYARAVCFDSDPDGVLRLQSFPYGSLFEPGNLIAGHESNSNNYAKGFFTEGAALMDHVLESTRKEAESCDYLQGFQIFHSLGGGTGSGTTALLIRNLVDEYPGPIISSHTVLPSPKVSNIVVEPYNSILALPELIENTHLTCCYDNDALHDICVKGLRHSTPTYKDMNFLVAHTIAGFTACMRFPGQLNTNLDKIYVNMVPFPNLHFFVPAFAPIRAASGSTMAKLSVAELVYELFNPNFWMVSCDTGRGKFLTASAIFRGRLSTRDVDIHMKNVKEKNSNYFVEWIPNNLKTAMCDIHPRGLKISASFVGNITSIQHVFHRLHNQFQAMFRRKGHLHWYTGEGMEEAEISEAGKNVKIFYTNYRDLEASKEEDNISTCGSLD